MTLLQLACREYAEHELMKIRVNQRFSERDTAETVAATSLSSGLMY